MSNARYWERGEADGIVQCRLCPRECRLKEGQRGLCFVRTVRDGELVLDTYGRSSGFCIDPIEKKPLNHFLPGTPILSFGTAGCNLQCTFCQNSSLSRSREMEMVACEASPEQIAEAARKTGCRSVAFTYNEPIIFLEYAVDIAKACHAVDIHTVAVTAGYINPAPCQEFFGVMDAANIDLKAFSDDFYREQCGATLQPVLDTIDYVVNQTSCWVELTTLLIPGCNDDSEELDAMTRWVFEHCGPDVPTHFTAFHPAHRFQHGQRTPLHSLQQACEIARGNGIRYVYTGNVYDPTGTSTRCAECGAVIIEREGYEIGGWGLQENGVCRSCGTTCAGVFEGKPGNWGSRCQRIQW